MIYCVELIRHYKHINNLFSFNGDLEVTKTVSLKTVVATYEKFYGWYLRPENGGDLCFIIRKKLKLKRLHTPRNAFGPASFILLN